MEQSAHNYSGVTPLHEAATCWKMPRNDTAVVVWRSSARKNQTTATWCLSASIGPGSISIGQYRGKCTLWGLKLLHFAEQILHCGTVGTQLQRCHSAARGCWKMPRNDTAAAGLPGEMRPQPYGLCHATPLCKAVSKALSNYQSVDKYRGKCTLCGFTLLSRSCTLEQSAATCCNMPRDDTAGSCLDVLCRTGLPREIKPPSCGLCLLPLYGKQNGKPQVNK